MSVGRTWGCQKRPVKVGHRFLAWAQRLLGLARRAFCLPPSEKTRGSQLPDQVKNLLL